MKSSAFTDVADGKKEEEGHEIPTEKTICFRGTSQFITWFSASLNSRKCIFEQEKTGKEARNERFLARAEGGGTLTAR